MSAQNLLAQLQPADQVFLLKLSALASPAARVALVGGAVRDALLGQTEKTPPPLDLDVVVEGADIEALAQASGLPFVFHPAFANATLSLPDGRGVDLVRARRESYPLPGQNPVPEPGTLEDDLRRRDFSVNALALLIPYSPRPLWEACKAAKRREGGAQRRKGEGACDQLEKQISASLILLDPTGGLPDLAARLLRPLHPHSFRDDPSRLIRGARLAARLNLTASPDLLAQIPDALALAQQTPRLWAELKLLLHEPRPGKAARLLHHWGAGVLLPGIQWLEALDGLQDAGTPVNFQAYAAALLSASPDPDALAHRLTLGDRPAALLSRAQSDTFFPADTPEMQLRRLLRPDFYVPLTGKDVVALGVPPGKAVGEALAHLAGLRRRGEVGSQTEEQAALTAYLRRF